MKIDSKEEWERLEKIAYDFLDTLNMKDIIKECGSNELGNIMEYIEHSFGNKYLKENNFNPEDECIFNRINEDDFSSYLYKRFEDDIYISWEERGYVHFIKEK